MRLTPPPIRAIRISKGFVDKSNFVHGSEIGTTSISLKIPWSIERKRILVSEVEIITITTNAEFGKPIVAIF